MEYDQYDTPAATYLVWLDGSGVARGCVRVTPTDRPYMIRDNWPEMCETRPLPDSLSEWEMTRLCVDDSLPKAMRRRVKRMLICALLEFGLANDIRRMIGVMPPKLWESVFGDVGCRIEFVGKVRIVGGGSARAGLLEITVAHLREARRASNILRAVLEGGLPCVDDYRLKAGRILLRLKVA